MLVRIPVDLRKFMNIRRAPSALPLSYVSLALTNPQHFESRGPDRLPGRRIAQISILLLELDRFSPNFIRTLATGLAIQFYEVQPQRPRTCLKPDAAIRSLLEFFTEFSKIDV